MLCYLIVLILVLISIYFYCCNYRNKGALQNYKSVVEKDIPDTGKYKDEIDYFMTPVAQAIQLENKPNPDKKKLYNTYNEAVRRYNTVSPKVKKHPEVPNIQTIVKQRNKVYNDLQREPVVVAPRTIVPVVAIVAPPLPIKKDNKKTDRLKIEIKSSAQNVHDHNVNDELSKRYNQLKDSNLAPDESKSYIDMLEFINKHDKSKRKIIKVFEISEPISRFNDDNEATIWSTVWRRIHSPDNKDNIEELKNSLADAVKDCTEDGELVCTTGRVTRALNSLTLMDKNESIASPIKTDDMERKEVYDRAHKILQEELDKKGDKFKESYESGDMSDKESEPFDDVVRTRISNELGSSPYVQDALSAI